MIEKRMASNKSLYFSKKSKVNFKLFVAIEPGQKAAY